MPQHADERPTPRPVRPAFAARRKKQGLDIPGAWQTWSRAELTGKGWTSRRITAAVRSGRLVRARENVYLAADVDADCADACRIGGRLTCVSELARWGVFALDAAALHVEVPATSSRLRTTTRTVRVHWSRRAEDGWACVDIVEALVQAVTCQPVRAAVATLDSALHLGLIGDEELDEVFAALPRRLRVLRRHLDRRAESGAESMMRLILRRMGCRVESQRKIPGVGRVDFLVDGWLIVECDSEAHHSGWEQQKKDRRRDQAAAARGFVTYRALAEDIFWHPEAAMAAIRGLRAARAVA